MLDSIQHITPTHRIELHRNDKAIVMLDPLRLEQVITNIISNASKYSPDAQTIEVSSLAQDGHITVSFTDHGIGVEKENLHNIFSRYYRVQESASQFSGMGIGLFVSSEIINQHGGKIWADSEPGKFTTIYLQLPLVKPEDQLS